MTNRFNFSDHQLLQGNVAYASIGLPTVGASLSIISAPGGNNRIKVLSAGLVVNGGSALGVKLALTDGITQVVLNAFGTVPTERTFVHGWDLGRNAQLFAQPVDVQGGVSWCSVNVEHILVTD